MNSQNDTPASLSPEDADIFDDLFAVIRARRTADPASSYVASLFADGTPAMAAKIAEEAAELAAAAGQNAGRGEIVHEICDLIFHSLVLAAHRDVSLDDIRSEFARRFGVSGHAEKAARQAAKPRE